MLNRAHAIIDSHCHLDFTAFDADRSAVLQACAENGVKSIVIPATTQARWGQTIRCCQSDTSSIQLNFALGLHPMFIDAHQPHHLVELESLARSSSAVAIGEIGLDFHSSAEPSKSQKEKQRLYFEKQVVIAERLNLPIIVHIRKAHDDCLQILRQHSLKGGIIHAFNGSFAQGMKYAELGFLLGFGGMLTFTRSRKLQELVKAIPIEHIALETDAPDMVVEAHRGERNSPEYLPHVLRAVAQHKSQDIEFVAKQTTNNVSSLFGLTDP